MQHTVRSVHGVCNLADGLDHACFVVSEHDRHQRPLGSGDSGFERNEIDDAVASDWQGFDLFGSEAAAAAHRWMLDCRHEQPIARLLAPANLDRRRQRVHVGFSSAAGERDVLCVGSDQVGDLLTRALDQTAGSTAFGVHRGGISGHFQRSDCGNARLLPQRSGRIPVKIGALSHDFRQYLNTVLPQKACFLPRGSC